MEKTSEKYTYDLRKTIEKGSPTDPDEVFKEVDRQRDSGELTDNLLQENSYLTDLDDQGNLVKRPGRKNR